MTHKTTTKTLRLALLGFCAIACVACAASWDEHISLAKSLQSEKRSTEAITVYEKALNKYPNHREAATVHLEIANLYYVTLQQPDRALKAYQNFIEKFPHDKHVIKAFQERARILEEQQDWPAAVVAYSELLQHFPEAEKKAEYHFKVATLHLKRGDTSQAKLELEKFIKEYENSPWTAKALFQMGEIYFHDRQFKKAQKYYGQIAKKFPNDPILNESEYNRGLCLEHLGNWNEALKAYKKILNTYPNPAALKSHIDKLEARRKATGRG